MGWELDYSCCDLQDFLHQLYHCQMAVNDLICLLCVYLMFSITCRISSTGGGEKLSSMSVSGGALGDVVMTSSGWCDTNIQSDLM